MFNESVYPSNSINHGATQLRRRGIDLIVTLLAVYYWLLQFTHGDAVEIISFDTAFYLYVVPAAGFAVLSASYIAFTFREIDKSAFILFIFCTIVVMISMARGDYRSIASLGLLGVSVAALFQIRPKISVNIVNLMLVSAAVITTLMYFFELSIYTFIPGIGYSYDLWWRVSPYPSVAGGALLAMFVLLVNLVVVGHPFRRTMIAISLYFVILSGSRTAISSLVIAGAYIIMNRQGFLNHRGIKYSFIAGSLIVFVVLIYASQLLYLLPFADNALLRTIILRDEAVTGFDFGGQVGTAAIRQWVFDQHIAAFWESPFIGIGTFDLRMLNSGYGALDNSVTGSEAFVTGLLARIGLVSTLLFAAVFLIRQPLRGRANELSTATRIALIVAMVTYGSFVNVYDVIFFLMIVAVTGGIEPSPRRAGEALVDGAPI